MLLLKPSGAVASGAFVQGKHSGMTSGTTVASASVTLTSTVGSGNCIVGMLIFDNTGSTDKSVTSVKDDKNNNYVFLDSQLVSDSNLWIFYLNNITNAPITITANFSPNCNFITLVVDEFSGILGLDTWRVNLQSSVGTTVDQITSGNLTTTRINDILWGATFGVQGSGTVTAKGTGFNLLELDFAAGHWPSATEWKTQSSIGTVAATFTSGSTATNQWETACVALAPGTPVMPSYWDAAKKGTSVFLYPGGGWGNAPITGGFYNTWLGTTGHSGGKWYFEVKWSDPATGHSWAVGVAPSTIEMSDTTNGWLGNSGTPNRGIGFWPKNSTGQAPAVYYGGSIVAATNNLVYATSAPGTIGVAVDLTNGKYWATLDGTNWNNSGSDNPGTNSGGYVNTVYNSTTVYPAGSGFHDENLFLRTGPLFTYTVPAGFTAWG